MKQKGALRTAEQHYRRKQYAQTISTLEPQIFLYRENTFFFHLLGLACMKTGDLGGARSYLMRATQIDGDAIAPRLALAACDLGRSDSKEALQMWLEILDEDPSNRYAQKGLSLLRSGLTAENGASVDTGAQLHKLYPDISVRRFDPKTLRRALVLLVFAAILAVSLAYAPQVRSLIQESGPLRDGSELTELPRRDDLVSDQDTGDMDNSEARYSLSDAEIRDTFDDLRRYFLAERDNMATREINRIVHSNAQETFKNQAIALRGYLRTPSFADFSDSFGLDAVRSDTVLYDGTFVRWRGRSSNLQISDEQVSFDFLVGYEDFMSVEAIVPVVFTRAVRIDPQLAIELIGRVRRDANSPEGFRIEGTSIRLIRAAES